MKHIIVNLIRPVILKFIVAVLAVFLFGTHTSVANFSEKKINPNGRNDVWDFVGIGGGGAMFSPTLSPYNPDIAFVSCDMGGSFITNNGGKSWKQVLEKDQHIGAITFDSRNGRFYACGFNGSAYFSEDGANNWIRIKGYNFKWGQRVEPDPRDPEKIFVITFGGGVWHGPAKGDDQAVEDIITPLKKI